MSAHDSTTPKLPINDPPFQRYPPASAEYDQVVQSSDLFWDALKSFHHTFGSKFKVPTVGGHALDLHRLFVEVTSRGGIEKVIRERKWKDVIAVFSFPTTITSASFVLRKFYLSLLYHFEQVYLFRKQFPSVSLPDTINGSLGNESATLGEFAAVNKSSGDQEFPLGLIVTGVIDGKFDDGYLVTVNLGSTQLKGVIYHIPQSFQENQNSHFKDASPRRRRKKRRFPEHYTQLKPKKNEPEKLWNNNLLEAEKQGYHEDGGRDLERENLRAEI